MQLPGIFDTKKYHSIALISIAGQLLVLLLAFLFHFAMARMLGVSPYGELGIILSIYAVLVVPVASMQTILMREVARLHKEGREAEINWLVKKYFRSAAIIGMPTLAVISIALYAIGLAEPVATAIMLMGIPFYYGICAWNAYFQGKQMPLHYSAVLVFMEAFRLGLSLLLVSLGYGILGVAIVSFLNMGILYAAGFVSMHKKEERQFPFAMKFDLAYVLPTNIIFSLFIVTDLFFVRYMLGAHDAGLYNAASMLARAIFYANVGLVAAFLPQASKLDLATDKERIRQALAVSIAMLAAIAAGLFLFKEVLLGVLYGKEYLAASPMLGVLSLSFLFLSGSILLANLLWSQREQKTPFVLSMAAYALFLILLYMLVPTYGTGGAVQASVLSTACLLLLSCLVVWKKISSAQGS